MRISAAFTSFVKDLALATGMSLVHLPRPQLPDVATTVVRRRLTKDGDPGEMAKLRCEDKQRYIVAPLLSAQCAGHTVRKNLACIHSQLRDIIVSSEGASEPKVLLLSPLEAAILKER